MTLGVDVGHQRIKAVLFQEGKLLTKVVFVAASGVDSLGLEAWAKIKNATPGLGNLRPRIFVTGVGRERVLGCEGRLNEVLCHLVGARFWNSRVRTVIDLGAEGTRVIKGDEGGKPIAFKLNDRCGAGTGVFLETVGSMLGMKIEEMGEIQMSRSPGFTISNTCAVFAESEIIGHIHRGISREEILSAVYDAVGAKVAAMVRFIAPEPEVLLAGGVARNRALTGCIKRHLGMEIYVPPEPELTGAIGAAVLGEEGEGVRQVRVE